MKGGGTSRVPKMKAASEIIAGFFQRSIEHFASFAQRQHHRPATPAKRTRKPGPARPAGSKLARAALRGRVGVHSSK